jgi:hypothetical protein
MSRNRDPQLPIPTVVSPSDTVCYQIELPNDDDQLAAFVGQISYLANWWAWDRDDAHSGKVLAALWQKAINTLKPCEVSKSDFLGDSEDDMTVLRINPSNTSEIQSWCPDDTGGHWIHFYPNGPTSGQQTSGGQGQPAPGQTQIYCSQVVESQPYLFPVQVSTGDVITVSEVSGAWSDFASGPLTEWFCPDGLPYTAGLCGPTGATHAGDPLPTVNHMRLLARIGSDYFDLGTAGTFAVPSGVSLQNMFLVPNTNSSNPGSGTISACVTVQAAKGAGVVITYALGSGPVSVADGSIVTMNSVFNSGSQAIAFSLSAPMKVSIISQTGFTLGTYPSPTGNWLSYDPGSGTLFWAYPPYYTPTQFTGMPAIVSLGFSDYSTNHAFTVLVKFENP